MIRWYDYPAAFIFAYFMLINFFTVPVFGAIIAYVTYEVWMNYYCQFRLRQENR